MSFCNVRYLLPGSRRRGSKPVAVIFPSTLQRGQVLEPQRFPARRRRVPAPRPQGDRHRGDLCRGAVVHAAQVFARPGGRRHRRHRHPLRPGGDQPAGHPLRPARGARRLGPFRLGAVLAVELRPLRHPRRGRLRRLRLRLGPQGGRAGRHPAPRRRHPRPPAPRRWSSAATTSSAIRCSRRMPSASGRWRSSSSTPTATSSPTRTPIRAGASTTAPCSGWRSPKSIIDPAHSVQIGIRTTYQGEAGHGMTVIHADKVHETPPGEVAAEIVRRGRRAQGLRRFDIDCLDPAFAPGTGTPGARRPVVAPGHVDPAPAQGHRLHRHGPRRGLAAIRPRRDHLAGGLRHAARIPLPQGLAAGARRA
jgi:hypothetical protein